MPIGLPFGGGGGGGSIYRPYSVWSYAGGFLTDQAATNSSSTRSYYAFAFDRVSPLVTAFLTGTPGQAIRFNMDTGESIFRVPSPANIGTAVTISNPCELSDGTAVIARSNIGTDPCGVITVQPNGVIANVPMPAGQVNGVCSLFLKQPSGNLLCYHNNTAASPRLAESSDGLAWVNSGATAYAGAAVPFDLVVSPSSGLLLSLLGPTLWAGAADGTPPYTQIFSFSPMSFQSLTVGANGRLIVSHTSSAGPRAMYSDTDGVSWIASVSPLDNFATPTAAVIQGLTYHAPSGLLLGFVNGRTPIYSEDNGETFQLGMQLATFSENVYDTNNFNQARGPKVIFSPTSDRALFMRGSNSVNNTLMNLV